MPCREPFLFHRYRFIWFRSPRLLIQSLLQAHTATKKAYERYYKIVWNVLVTDSSADTDGRLDENRNSKNVFAGKQYEIPLGCLRMVRFSIFHGDTNMLGWHSEYPGVFSLDRCHVGFQVILANSLHRASSCSSTLALASASPLDSASESTSESAST